MEAADTVHILMRVSAWAAVIMLALALAGWWRLRDVIRRYRSVRAELDSLCRRRDASAGHRRAAFDIVIDRCTRIYRDPFPKFGSLAGLEELVREVARCYHPDLARPELAVRCGRLLRAARSMSWRTEALLKSPGFGRLYGLRLRTIRYVYSRVRRLQRSAVLRAAMRVSGKSTWLLRSRLLVFPDPFSWLAFLSQRLVVMSLLRCVLTDLYLAAGSLAVECYDDEEFEDGCEEAAPGVPGFGRFLRSDHEFPDPRIRDIRRSLPGVRDPFSPGKWGLRWRRAVERAALVFASDQFPSSSDPLEEATFGAMVERMSAWLLAFSELERKPMMGTVMGVRLEKILGLRDVAAGDVAAAAGRVFRSCRGIYGGIRVPVTAARWISRGSPGRVALEAGWTLAGRIVASYCLKYGFDLACRELDVLYRKSRSGAGPDTFSR